MGKDQQNSRLMSNISSRGSVMRVALFFDGKNFYHGLREVQSPDYRINFPRLANWLREKTNGSVIVGAYYYTGVEPPSQELPESAGKLEGFLKIIQSQRGFYVRRFPRWRHTDVCKKCGEEHHYTHEKQVDTSIVADMVKGAAIDAYDVAILLSGDADFIPAIEVVNSLGKQVYVATWNGIGQAERIRSVAYDLINLTEGINKFEEIPKSSTTSTSLPDEAPVEPEEEVEEDEGERYAFLSENEKEFLYELERAQKHFGRKRFGNDEPGFVGLGFFMTKWQSDDDREIPLPSDPDLRRELLDELTSMGRVEVYNTGKGSMAIRINPNYIDPNEFDIRNEWAEEEADAS